LIDDYLNDTLNDSGITELEQALRDHPEALRYFARYARLHTDLHLEVRSHRLSARVLDQIRQLECETKSSVQKASAPRRRRRLPLASLATAAALLLALSALAVFMRAGPVAHEPTPDPAI